MKTIWKELVCPIQSDEDERQYRHLTLVNGMICLLISDAITDKESAAINVNVGHFSDPKSLPGIAHFLEHMLFLGTQKYPGENSYSEFLSEHGGSSNAYTSNEDTNFYFDVTAGHLEPALDRFAQFFISPLMTESATERELNAVENEHAKNILSDSWRKFQLLKSTVDSDNVMNRFGTGNRDTLEKIPASQGVNVREELLKFHKQHYSSARMGLVILGRDSLDELERICIEKFGEVSSKGAREADVFQGQPFNSSCLQKTFFIVPVKDLRTLTLSWQFPCTETLYRSKPLHFLSHLLGHEGSGSILSLLKNKSWATRLSAGPSMSTSSFTLFSINIDLTDEGLRHTDEIIGICFDTINIIRQGDTATLQRLFTEVQSIGSMHFRFAEKQEPSSMCCHYARKLRIYAPEDILHADYVFMKFDEDLIRRFLNDLTVEGLRVDIMSKEFSGTSSLQEYWYSTEYNVQPFSSAFIKSLSHRPICNQLSLPNANHFIATDFTLMNPRPASSESQASLAVPRKIEDKSNLRLWHKCDDVFYTPRVSVQALYTTSVTYDSPRQCVLSTLYVRLLEDSLIEFAYDAELAGLSYSLVVEQSGLYLELHGFSHKMNTLLSFLATRMTNLVVDNERFDVISERLLRQLQNFALEQPYRHILAHHTHATELRFWSREVRIDALRSITAADVTAHIPSLFVNGHWEALVHGNVMESTAKILIETLISEMPKYSLHVDSIPQLRIVQLEAGKTAQHVATVCNSDEKNSAVCVYYQVGEDTVFNRAILLLLEQVIHEPFFHQLRTVEQLGYLVFSGYQLQRGVLGFRFIIQSSDHPAHFLLSRIQNFVNELKSIIEDMSEDKFNMTLESVIASRLEKDKKLQEESHRYWDEIILHRYSFSRRHNEAQQLKEFTRQNLLDFYDKYLAVSATERRELQLLEEAGECMSTNSSSYRVIDTLESFKRSLPLYPSFS